MGHLPFELFAAPDGSAWQCARLRYKPMPHDEANFPDEASDKNGDTGIGLALACNWRRNRKRFAAPRPPSCRARAMAARARDLRDSEGMTDTALTSAP